MPGCDLLLWLVSTVGCDIVGKRERGIGNCEGGGVLDIGTL